nr:GHKL domain-containing protein [Eubacterium sp.]
AINEEYLYIYILTLSKFLIFMITLVLRYIFSYSEEYKNSSYNFFLLVTPIMSIVITMQLPRISKASPEEFEGTFICILMLIIINIFHYVLFFHSISYYNTLRKNKMIQQQMNYQSANYSHIQNSYRNTRKIIHETKSTFTTIEEYIEKKEYDKLIKFTREAKKNFDSEHPIIRTDNIVIDALINNFLSVTYDSNIKVTTNIAVNPNHIKPNDYDLSIILSNLLDNALNAVQKISENAKRVIDIDIITNDTSLVINIENPFSLNQETNNSFNNINHGYGIENVTKLVLKYDGNYTYGSTSNNYYTSTVIIPYDLTEDEFLSFIKSS